jgi:hypothetical protein
MGGFPGGGGSGEFSGSLTGGFFGRLGGSSTGGLFCNRISFIELCFISNPSILTFYLFPGCLRVHFFSVFRAYVKIINP